jgi:hypothetical protein
MLPILPIGVLKLYTIVQPNARLLGNRQNYMAIDISNTMQLHVATHYILVN